MDNNREDDRFENKSEMSNETQQNQESLTDNSEKTEHNKSWFRRHKKKLIIIGSIATFAATAATILIKALANSGDQSDNPNERNDDEEDTPFDDYNSSFADYSDDYSSLSRNDAEENDDDYDYDEMNNRSDDDDLENQGEPDDVRILHTTQEWSGYGKQNYYYNQYRLKDNTVYRFKCNRFKHFDGKENEWVNDERLDAKWDIDDPNMPEWLKNKIG